MNAFLTTRSGTRWGCSLSPSIEYCTGGAGWGNKQLQKYERHTN